MMVSKSEVSTVSASNFNLRGIPTEVMSLLKKEAKRLHMSVNAFALKMIEKGLGVNTERVIRHDLDDLSGSWSSEEEKAFKKNTEAFEKIDEELWS